MLKKVSFLLLTLTIVFILGACSSGDDANGSANNDANQSNDTSNNAEEPITFTFAHVLQTDKPEHEGALKFKELVEERSNGQLIVEISPAAQLGDERELMQSVQTGALEATAINAAVLSNESSAMEIPGLPFLVKNKETMYQLLDGEVGEEMMATLEGTGLKGTAFWESGFKHITADREILKPEDMEGVQFRTMESQLIMDTYSQLGANPVAIAFSEVYTSLQQGVVNGQENPLGSIATMKFYEVQDYLSLVGIAYSAYGVVFNEEWFSNLSDEHQEIILTASKEAGEYERGLVAESEEGFLNEIKESGTTVLELTDEQKVAFQEATKPVHDKYRDIVGPELFDNMKQIISEIEGN